jgi:hypothetical protein
MSAHLRHARIVERLLAPFALLLAAIPLHAQTRATLIESVNLPLVQNGKTIGTAQARAGTVVQILSRTGDSVEISTPIGVTTTPSANLLPIEDAPAEPSPPAPSSVAVEGTPKKPRPAVPVRSSIRIREATDKKNLTGKCRGFGETRTFSPAIKLGSDAEGLETRFRFFVVFKTWIKNPTPADAAQKSNNKPSRSNPLGLDKLEREDGEIKILASQKLDEAVCNNGPLKKTANFGWFNMTCPCCRLDNPPVKPQFIGWHAELLAGDKLLVSEQSSDDDRIAAAVEELKANPPLQKNPSANRVRPPAQ